MSSLPPLSDLFGHLAAGSWLMLPLVLVTVGIWHTYLATVAHLRESLRCVDFDNLQLSDRLERLGPAALAEELAPLPGAIPRLARHILLRVRAGLPFREACTQCRSAETNRFGYGLIVLGALVVAAPLLGLLGTVLGMIETFEAVAANTSETANLVASGISKALITTQVGLLAALPGTLGLAHVFRLYRRLANAADLCESHLAIVFEHARDHREGKP